MDVALHCNVVSGSADSHMDPKIILDVPSTSPLALVVFVANYGR